ncbi:MAG: hypothetical protein LBM07_08680 [Culturomica sp.]|nr:hypothetical protein [Culturomica sp.]
MNKALFFLLLLFSFELFAQNDAEKTNLNNELETAFFSLKQADKKKLVENFMNVFNSDFLTDCDKQKIDSVFFELRGLRLAPVPYLKNYLEIVMTFYSRNQKENLQIWLEGLEECLSANDKKRSTVNDYIVLTHGIITDSEFFIRRGSHQWFVRGDYKWLHSSEGLKIDIDSAIVVCKTLKDSIFIHKTHVDYYFTDNLLHGAGGTVYWNDTMYAELKKYVVNMETSDYKADSVMFHFPSEYPDPIEGELRDNALKYSRNKDVKFPRFVSYSNEIKIDSIFAGISYEGGILYEGQVFFGVGDDDQQASLHIAPNDTMNLYVYSKRFSIDTLRILSGVSNIKLDLEGKNITHSLVGFTYTKHNNIVAVKRTTEQSMQIPFRDEYHQLLMDVDEFIWKIDTNIASFRMTSRSGLLKAGFESINFFSDAIFDNMQGLDAIHPLNGLYQTSVVLNDSTFSLGEYAEYMKKPIGQLRRQIVLLSYDDFLYFDEKNDKVTLKSRLYDYIRARIGKQDYDNLSFVSLPDKGIVNAQLNLADHSLTINGVKRFTISENKNIFVEPAEDKVVLHQNRDMEFSGKLNAGMFDMFGNSLFFSYKDYEIKFPKVDSMTMYLADKFTNGRGEVINSMIRDIKGSIQIDKPDNKSGSKNISGYPILNSTSESYVYFEDIANGEYKKDSFYFVLQPYIIKDINDGNKIDYAFNGRLVSNILPDIDDRLKLMPDKYMGMEFETPLAGLSLYGHGNVKSKIMLDKKGMIADGSVSINHSDFESHVIKLLPDSLVSETKLFSVNAIAGKRPGVTANDIGVNYLRKSEVLYANNRKEPFVIYDGRVKHSGSLLVYDDLLDASGNLELKGAVLSSSLFNIQENNIISQKANLRLGSITNKNIQLNTANVQAHIDLIKNTGKFINNTDENMADFPSNHFRSSFKSFTWYMNEEFLNIGIEDNSELTRLWKIENENELPPLARNVFVSTLINMDSLRFIAPLAQYNLATGEIACRWVNHVDIANGRFYPETGEIFIANDGDIKEFTNGKLFCETQDSLKNLTEVNLKLRGRYNFNGSGNFNYVNQDKELTIVRFNRIGLDSLRNISATADLAEDKNFKLNNGILYKGEMVMNSKKPDMFYDGYIKLSSDPNYLKQSWMRISEYLKFQEVSIPIAFENKNDKSARIYNGIFLNVDKTVKPYAVFTGNRLFYNDNIILEGKGELTWIKDKNLYTIKDVNKKYYHFDYIPDKEEINGFGKLNMAMNMIGIQQEIAGDIGFIFKEETFYIRNALYNISFELLPKMKSIIYKDFTDNHPKRVNTDEMFVEKLVQLYGNEVELKKQLAKNSNNVPAQLNGIIVLDSLNIEWKTKSRSYVANDKVLIRSMLNTPVEKEWEIVMECIPRYVSNQMFIYLKKDETWYYFEYSNNNLFTLSSNLEYNDALRNEDEEKKIITTNDKEKKVLYTITLCPSSKIKRFLQKIEGLSNDTNIQQTSDETNETSDNEDNSTEK